MEDLKAKLVTATNNGLAVFEYFILELKQKGTGKNFRSVFRDDGDNPDAGVFFNKEAQIWCYHDFVTGETLNPFDFVMHLKKCDFNEALRIIKTEVAQYVPDTLQPVMINAKTIRDFSIVEADNVSYWADFCETTFIRDILKQYGVKSLKSYSFQKNGKEITINASPSDPIFAYMISENCYKIYRPKARDKKSKHLWLGDKPKNYKNIYGVEQLPEFVEYILLVEGLKDVITANANGIPAIGVDNASVKITSEDIELIKKKCHHLIVCYDIDNAGLNASDKTASQHDLSRLTLPESLLKEGGKDISDFFFFKHEKQELINLIEEAINVQNQKNSVQNSVQNKNAGRLSKFEKVEVLITQTFDLRFNVVSNEIEYRGKNEDSEKFNVLNENNIYRFLQHNNIEFSMAKLTSLLRSDFVKRYNPFSDYFESLPEWIPGKDIDYIGKLCNYLPVKDEERFRIQFLKALVRVIACASDEKVINKQALILVHEEQNSGKSTFIRWLCPPALSNYISENISTDKDSLIALSDNFIINMDELATLSRAEINTLKSMFSKETIKIRRPYDKNATSAPRRASFFGSTNKAEFLTDETGSVRWLCFELTSRINWDYKIDFNIDDIWRQAYSLYKTGFKYELTIEEIQENETINSKYQVNTPEIELIQKNYYPGTKEEHDAFYQATDFLINLSEKCTSARLNLNNIGKALKLLGFEKTNKRADKFPVKGYYIRFTENPF